MRVFTTGVTVVDGLLGARLCLLAVCIFVCSIDCSNLSDTVANATTEEVTRHHPNSLSEVQLNSAFTIEFNFKQIDKKNRAAVTFAYREARRKILDKLNNRRKHSTSPSPTIFTTVPVDTTIVATTIATTAVTTADVTTTATPAATSTITTLASTAVTTIPTTIVTTVPTTIATTVPTEPTTITTALETTQTALAVEITTETPTTVSTASANGPPASPPNIDPESEGKRKRRNAEGNNSTLLTDDDLCFIDNGLEIDENGILRISICLNTTEISDEELWKALNELETEEGGFKEIAPVIDIYRGLPPFKAAMADIRVWLPILFAIIILIIIFIIVYCCWKTTNKKVRDVEHQKIVPKQDSKPTPSNGHAHPRILDDNSGWLVPYELFGSEQK
jgi:hypothetical protein